MLIRINIEYCAVWNYTNRAASLAAELLEVYEEEIEALTLTPSDGGRFEVTVNNKLVYSKLHTRRHVEPGEVVRLIGEIRGRGE